MSLKTCADIQEHLSVFAANECEGTAFKEISIHLEQCSACASIVAEFKALSMICHQDQPKKLSQVRALTLFDKIRIAITNKDAQFTKHEVLTLEEVAAYLRVDPEDLVEELPLMPTFEIGGRIRIRRKSLIAWIEERERHARSHRLLSLVKFQ